MPGCPHEAEPQWFLRILEDDLSGAEHAELAAHLEECPDCRRRLDSMAAESELWAGLRLLREGAERRATVGDSKADEAARNLDELVPIGLIEPSSNSEQLGRIGAYDILRIIGRGGMGIVFLARDPSLDRLVAIKVLTPNLALTGSARRRFAREAKAVAAVVHEHVVAIHAVDMTPQGIPYLVMQYVAGRSVQDLIDSGEPPDLCTILRIGMQAAQGLAAAHAQGLIHRDIKPANILLENGVERVKITDFGLARAVDDATMTQSGIVAGTPQYMAPEQALGDAIDQRADLFSLGSVLYALCTGCAPFRGNSSIATLKRVCEETPRPIASLNPEIPAWLIHLVERLHVKSPEDRYRSAAEVAGLLERCLAHVRQPLSVPLPMELSRSLTNREPTPRRKPRFGWKQLGWYWTGGIVIGLLALSFIPGQNPQDPEPPIDLLDASSAQPKLPQIPITQARSELENPFGLDRPTLVAEYAKTSPAADGVIGPAEYGTRPVWKMNWTAENKLAAFQKQLRDPTRTPLIDPNEAPVVEVPIDHKTVDDLSVAIAAVYTDRSLFLAFRVTDQFVDAQETDRDYPNFNDSIELFIDGDRVPNDFDHNLRFGNGTLEGFQLIVDAAGHQFTGTRAFTNHDWKAAAQKTEDGYAIEIEIPLELIDTWNGLLGFQPAKEGSLLNFTIAITDNDAAVRKQSCYAYLRLPGQRESPFLGGETAWDFGIWLKPESATTEPKSTPGN